jgi:hypothetical protein
VYAQQTNVSGHRRGGEGVAQSAHATVIDASGGGSDELGLSAVGLAQKLVRRALHDTTCDGQSATHAGEVGVDFAGAHAALVDAPDDEGLATAAITSGEDAVDVGAVLARWGLDVLASILLDHTSHDLLLGAKESHGQEDEVGREDLLAALDLLHVPAAASGLGPLNANGLNALDVALAVVDELLGHDAVLTRVLAHVGLDLSVAVVHTVDARPLRPWVVAGTLCRRLRKQLEVDDVLGTVANGSTNAVVTSVTTTNHDNVLALGGDVGIVGKLGVKQGLGVLVQKLHGKVNSLEVAVGNGKVTRHGGTSGDDHGVVFLLERVESDVALTNEAASDVLDALGGHEVNTALNDILVELHIGDTVHEQTTNTVRALVDSHLVTSLVELVGSGKTSRSGTDDGDSLTRAPLGRSRDHPAHLEATVDDCALNGLDANGVLVDAEDASTLTGSRADTSSELREVVGHEQTVESVLPLVLLQEKNMLAMQS